MKIFVAYTIWCKVDMISWLLEGITKNYNPQNTEIGICFDACTDGTEEAFNAMRKYWLDDRKYKTHTTRTDKEVTLVGGTNRLLKTFIEQTDCQMMLCPQDDQRLISNIEPDLQKLTTHYGPKLGGISGRDGFNEHGTNLVCADWSAANTTNRLKNGEWAERPYYNDGPIIYPRHLVDKIGYLDERFYGYYVWCDYGARATNAGLTNIILGMDITHAKFGRMPTSWLNIAGDKASEDLKLLNSKHGNIM